MKTLAMAAGVAVVLAAAALVGGFFGVQKYIDWLIAGAKRPVGPASLGPRK